MSAAKTVGVSTTRLPLATLRAPAAARSARAVTVRKRDISTHAFALGPETAAYGVLGASLAGFVTTFGIIPRYKENFKEEISWNDIYNALCSSGGVPMVSPEEAAAVLQRDKRVCLLDVRLQSTYLQSSPSEAMSTPLYQPIANWDLASNIRRLGFAFFGLAGTEPNPQFIADVEAVVPDKGTPILLLCENGGSLENKSGTQFGFQSRSLKAAHYLRQAGYDKVSCVAGGIRQWASDGLPLVEREDIQEGQEAAEGAY